MRTSVPRSFRRRLPLGAEPGAEGTHFRVWAPLRRRVEAVLEGGPAFRLEPEAGGYFSGLVEEARPGTLYRFRLDGLGPFPDPASRFQPEGPHGPSMVVDPGAFAWTDAPWRGVRLQGQVLYELHVGTFTPEGTWEAAAGELPRLAELGVTLVEVMPAADFPGRFGWGYDGVDLFAPTRLYGSPDDFRRFVDRAHALGLGVLLDFVANHLGPDGCFLREFSGDYFSRRRTEWGDAINYASAPVREFFTACAACWISEFHLDGLRLDATQDIHDDSTPHILAELAARARAAAGGRSIVLVAENEPQQTRLVAPPGEGGYGLDGLWNDDFHHSALVALTGRAEAYLRDYRGSPQELISAAKRGYLYQGQFYQHQGKRRGSSTFGMAPWTFVNYLENHDQVSNLLHGLRRHQTTSPGRHRAMTALLLLAPGTPLLFMGQEFSASSPFVFFADHRPELREAVRRGRRDFLAQFPSMRGPDAGEAVPDPGDPRTFARCKLDLSEGKRNAAALALHRDLLRLRRSDPVFNAQLGGERLQGAVLGPEALVLRYLGGADGDRLLVLNLGADLDLPSAPEPLLAPPDGGRWRLVWSSEAPAYGGSGAYSPVDERQSWRLAGHAASVLSSRPP